MNRRDHPEWDRMLTDYEVALREQRRSDAGNLRAAIDALLETEAEDDPGMWIDLELVLDKLSFERAELTPSGSGVN